MNATGFDIRRFTARGFGGHGGAIGIVYHDHGTDWAELALPYRADLAGDAGSGAIAAGAILTLMDMATSMAVWVRRDRFVPQATLDLRIDHLRAPAPGRTVIGRGICTRIAPGVAFVRGEAHDGDPDDPLAQVTGSFMLMDAM